MSERVSVSKFILAPTKTKTNELHVPAIPYITYYLLPHTKKDINLHL